MRKFLVTAVAMDRQTRQSIRTRGEVVDTKNVIFSRVKTPLDVEIVYERFWNLTNEESEHIVKVIDVQEVK